MAREDASVARTRINHAAIVDVAMKEAFEERASKVHVEHSTRRWLIGKVKRSGIKGSGTSTAT